MNRNVVLLHPRPRSVGHFVHLGHGCHRQLQNLLSHGGLPLDRAVIDAAHVAEQRELMAALKQEGKQLILDTRAMELALPGGVTSLRSQLPWARPEEIWTVDTWGRAGTLIDICKRMAEFAVSAGVDVVLAPTHFHHKQTGEWLRADVRATELLRQALDSAGGESIGLDYPLAAAFPVLQSATELRELRAALQFLPFDNLWLRADEFGIHASAARTKNLLYVANELARIGKPLVLDQAGGFPALAVAAFGVVGGISHGIANQNEQFRSYYMRTPPKKREGGGTPKWVYLASVDQYIRESNLDALFEIRGTRPHLICNDSSCCRNGIQSMKQYPRRHALQQRVRQLVELSQTPEHQRPEHLLRYELQPAGQRCRMIERIPALESTEFHSMFKKQARHLDDLGQLVEQLLPKRYEFARSSEPVRRHSHVMPKVSGL